MIEQQTQASTRTDLISGLRTLRVELRVVARLPESASPAAPLSPSSSTPSGQQPSTSRDPSTLAARRLADRHGWPQDQINDTAKVSFPTGYGARMAERVTVHDDDHIRVQIVAPETLFVMKLHAAQRRGNRDAPT